MIWASWLFLLASLCGAWFAYNALVPRRRGVYAATWSFIAGLVTADLALHHIAWQAIATAVFASFGAFEALPGQIGLTVTAGAWLALAQTQLRSRRASDICERALCETLAPDTKERVSIAAGSTPAVAKSRDLAGSVLKRLALAIPMLPSSVERIRNIQYSRIRGLNLCLDIYRPRNHQGDCPVLFQIHGGGWMVDNKDHQALPLMHRMASHGWICVSVDYRLSPHATFPEHAIDTKRALAWVKQHIAGYGGDPNFIIATGGSAGGHLCALAALTPNDPEYQPGFTDVDTTVQGCMPFYGVFDLTGATDEHDGQAELFEKYVMKGSRLEIPEAYDRASPLQRIDDQAPPFFVIHGDCDSLVPVDQARGFVRELRAKSRAPVAYAELPGAQHAFDVFHNLRTSYVVDAAERFANTLHQRYRAGEARQESAPTVSQPQLRVV